MKAVRVHDYGPSSVMGLETIPDPVAGPGEVVIRLRAAGVNPVDTYLRSGAQGYAPPLPFTPGLDGSGVIEALGEGVTGHAVGDRVYVAGTITGSYAELARCRAARVYPLPAEVDFPAGACLGVPYGTAYRALVDRAGARPGERVLIHGASGGVGLAAVQLSRMMGLTILATTGSTPGRTMVTAAGADHVLDHRDPTRYQAILELTHGRGVDVALEMLADRNLGEVLGVMAPAGRVVIIGSRGQATITPRQAMAKDLSVLGMSLLNCSDADLARIHGALAVGLVRRALQPVVGRSLPLGEAATAHEAIIAGPAAGNIILTIP